MPSGDWLHLADRRTLVAGAGGLGGASAVALAMQGARVVLVDIDEGFFFFGSQNLSRLPLLGIGCRRDGLFRLSSYLTYPI